MTILILSGLFGCSEMALAGRSQDFSDTGGGGNYAPTDPGEDDDYDDGYGGEDEESFLQLEPTATSTYVFVANPERDTVTRVSVPGLQVITTGVGRAPVSVVTTPDYQTAATFNAGDETVSIIDAETLEVDTVDVRNNLNRMEMSPDGRWAVLFNDPDVELEHAPAETGTLSYNEVSLVNIEDRTSFSTVVGFHPTDLKFTPDGAMAVLASDAYLGLLDLSGDELGDPVRIEVTDDLIDPPPVEEVVLSPDGTWAFVRQYGVSDLVLVDLLSGTRDLLEVGDNPTDLDLTVDGTKAVAVARGSHELWIYDTVDPLGVLPEVVAFPTEEIFGSVLMSPSGEQALLYTTATTQTTHYATWSLKDDAITVRALQKPIKAIDVSPDGGTALVIHPIDNGPDLPQSSPFYDKYAITMVDLGSFLTNALVLANEPIGYANSDDGTTGFFVMRDVPQVVALDYNALLDYPVALASNPIYLGVLPETTIAWVSQEHDLGRISFYNPPDTIQTLTGFELNAEIETE